MLWVCGGPENGSIALIVVTLRRVCVSDMLSWKHC